MELGKDHLKRINVVEKDALATWDIYLIEGKLFTCARAVLINLIIYEILLFTKDAWKVGN